MNVFRVKTSGIKESKRVIKAIENKYSGYHGNDFVLAYKNGLKLEELNWSDYENATVISTDEISTKM